MQMSRSRSGTGVRAGVGVKEGVGVEPEAGLGARQKLSSIPPLHCIASHCGHTSPCLCSASNSASQPVSQSARHSDHKKARPDHEVWQPVAHGEGSHCTLVTGGTNVLGLSIMTQYILYYAVVLLLHCFLKNMTQHFLLNHITNLIES